VSRSFRSIVCGTPAPACPLLDGVVFSDQVIDEVTEFMKALTDPSARNLDAIIPERVPSGLTIDGQPGT
jgi:hypothetical protein